MKSYAALLSALLILGTVGSSCSSGAQGDAKNLVSQIESTVKENTPGSLKVSEKGNIMEAKINGKEWMANSMLPATEHTGRIIGYYNTDYISFPYDKRDMVVGKKRKLNGVDFVNKENGICGGTNGEMTITKVDSNWVEGTFYFTVTSCNNTPAKIEVTDGFFRIPVEL